MKYSYILIAIFLFCTGCKTNRTANGEREGLWIEKTEIGETKYKSRGRYDNGFEKKTWRYFENGKLVRKEVYKDSVCLVTHYKKGKKSLEGYTRLRVSEKDIHWFYTGDWHEYDALGNLVAVRTYKDGELVGETEVSAD